ncbi:MAG TPA: LpqN/LpqT family lipoprotein [Mycobacterium sp.]|nr:LpqN/LpqT family lipoprotein [Mycobacterium sp.]
MRAPARVAALLACTALTVGCGPKTPDYQAIWTTTSKPASATTAEAPVPVAKYLEDSGVGVEQVAPGSLTDLTVSIPTPPGWSKRQDPNLPPGTQVIGQGDKYPSAILTVFKLTGNVNAAEVVKHGLTDATLSRNFHRLDSSTADFHGFPSAMVQGSHDLGSQRVHTWFRMVVATGRATGSPPAGQHYLVQLTIVTLADQAAKQAADVEAVINGFTVAAK